MGGGTHTGLAQPLPTAQQGLRGTAGNRRDLGSYSDGSSHAQKTKTNLTPICHTPLRVLLRSFLEKDGSDPALIEELFSGIVERVVAIVSRVQGAYEFDVQTLREYFAARHLYQTAPYSPAGGERRGTISDRWRALSRNYYWLNVARFYAGCYSEGELPSLIDDLRDLRDDEGFRCTSHPQLLTASLLGDWVFSQRPRAIQDAVDLLLEPRGLRMLVAGAGSGLFQVEDVIVRDTRGRHRLIAACKELVRPNRPVEQVMEVVRSVLRPNSEPEELFDWWIEELRSAEIAQASQWCAISEFLQCWSIVNLDTVSDLFSREEVPKSSVIAGLLHANRTDVFESDESLFEDAVEAILAGDRIGWARGGSILQRFAGSLEWMSQSRHRLIYPIPRRLSPFEYWGEIHGHEEDNTWPNFPAANRCMRVVQAFKDVAELPVKQWNNSIEPWDRVVQQGISEFGNCKRFVEIANIAAGIRSKEEKCQDSPDLFDLHQPMVRRARHARLRASSRKWWSEHLQSATNTDDVWMALLIFSTWAGPRTIEELAEEFDRLVVSLETSEWHSLHSSLRTAVEVNSDRPWIRPLTIRVSMLPSTLSIRTVALIMERSTTTAVDELYERFLNDYQSDDSIVLSLRAEVEAKWALKDETKWSQAIERLRSTENLGEPLSRAFLQYLIGSSTLPDKVAREVMDQPLDFPSLLVRVAEARCRQLDAAKILPVGRVADDEGWFTD